MQKSENLSLYKEVSMSEKRDLHSSGHKSGDMHTTLLKELNLATIKGINRTPYPLLLIGGTPFPDQSNVRKGYF